MTGQARLALLVAACFFMEMLDGTMVTTAAPRIAAEMRVPVASVGLVVTAYLVTLAVLIPFSGWLVGRFGVRSVFLAAICLFTAASGLCAASGGLAELVPARVLQGCGGAMMVPVGRLAVLGGAAKRDLARLVSFIVWPGLAAPVVAPLLGALITTGLGWRWMFVVNLPLGLAALLAALRLVPRGRTGQRTVPLDWPGGLLLLAGIGGLTCVSALVAAPRARVGLLAPVAVAAAVALLLALARLRRARHPLVDLAVLRIASYRSALANGGLFYLGMASVPFLLPLRLEAVFGWSATRAGVLVLCLFAGNIGIKPAANALVDRFGYRAVQVATGLGLAATMVALGLLTRHTPFPALVAVAALSGMCRSVAGTSYNTLIYGDVPPARMPHANTLSATCTQLSFGYGVALAAVALRLAPPGGGAYRDALCAMAVLPLLAAAGAARLPADAGAAVRRQRAGTRTRAGALGRTGSRNDDR